MKNIFSKILKNFIPPIFFKVYHIIYLNTQKEMYYGLDNIDKKIEKYLNFNNGFFIEIGAHNGIMQSNTYYLEKNKNWRGVLIEPSPNNYILCKKNRSKFNKVYCNACVSFSYKEEFVKIAYAELVSTAIYLESDIDRPLLQAQKGLTFLKEDEIPIYGAIAKTMNEILVDSNAPQDIDFFSLDVEGSEIEVLKGIDYNTYQFKYILIESRRPKKIEEFLINYNYRLIEKLSFNDYLFKLV